MKKTNRTLSFRTESIRRLDHAGLARAAGGKKKDDGNTASDTGENHSSDRSGGGGGGSGHGRGLTTTVEHEF